MTTEIYPVNESIQAIDSEHWLIANRILLSHTSSPSHHQSSWGGGNGAFFVLSETTESVPKESNPIPETSQVKKVYEAGTISTVWQAGEAFIKVHKITNPKATQEHVTLDWLRDKGHAEFDGRYYIILSRLPGQTLGEIWPDMEETRQQIYAHRITEICNQLTLWKSHSISGVDGRYILELYLTKRGLGEECDPDTLLQYSQELGINCSAFVFYHCDLGPGNIVVDDDGSLGIIDWETAGFVPREWVRTKFRLSSGMDLPLEDPDAKRKWRGQVAKHLNEMGYADVVDNWVTSHK